MKEPVKAGFFWINMSYLELFLIAVGLSMDAFAVSLCKGLEMQKFRFKNALLLGGLFGLFQAFMPLLGFYLSKNFVQYMEQFDHWIAFFLLVFIGGKMIKEARQDDENNGENGQEKKTGFQLTELLFLAVATSIDALAVGITFAVLSDINIYFACLSIGLVTFVLCIAAACIGHAFGTKLGSSAEYLGGAILILLGCKILAEHLGLI